MIPINYGGVASWQEEVMSLILIDPKFCVTHKTNPLKVNRYFQSLQQGAQFPAIEAVQVGLYFVVRDGNHRAMAHLKAGEPVWAQVFTEAEYSDNLWLLGKRLAQAKRMNYNKTNEKASHS